MSKMAAEVCLEGVAPSESTKGLWNTLLSNLADLRCQLIHKNISRPVNGKYRCWSCLREFDSGW